METNNENMGFMPENTAQPVSPEPVPVPTPEPIPSPVPTPEPVPSPSPSPAPAAALFCKNCGTPLGAGQQFCPKCGAKADAPKKGVKFSKKTIIIAAVIVALLVGLAILLSYMPNYLKNRNFKNGVVGNYTLSTAMLNGTDYVSTLGKIKLTVSQKGVMTMGTVNYHLKLTNGYFSKASRTYYKIKKVEGGSNDDLLSNIYYDPKLDVMYMRLKVDSGYALLIFKKDSGLSLSSSSSSSSSSNKGSSSSSASKTVTESQAISLAKSKIESQITSGNVICSNKKAKYFDIVLFGEVKVINSSGGSYTVKVNGTCWGEDSYGQTVAKFTFSTVVYISDNGSATCPNILLTKA